MEIKLSLKAPAPDAVPGDFPPEMLRLERLVTCMPAVAHSFILFLPEGIYLIFNVPHLNLQQIIFHVNFTHHLFRIVKGVLPTYNEQDYNYLWITHPLFSSRPIQAWHPCQLYKDIHP